MHLAGAAACIAMLPVTSHIPALAAITILVGTLNALSIITQRAPPCGDDRAKRHRGRRAQPAQ